MTGRLAALRSPSGALVLDNTYNANPDSMRAAIDVLAASQAPRYLVRTWATWARWANGAFVSARDG